MKFLQRIGTRLNAALQKPGNGYMITVGFGIMIGRALKAETESIILLVILVSVAAIIDAIHSAPKAQVSIIDQTEDWSGDKTTHISAEHSTVLLLNQDGLQLLKNEASLKAKSQVP